MWMTREEIASHLNIVVNSVRGKVKKGQIERKVIDGKNYYRIVDPALAPAATDTPAAPVSASQPDRQPAPEPGPAEGGAATRKPEDKPAGAVTPVAPPSRPVERADEPALPPPVEERSPAPERTTQEKAAAFNPKKILLDLLASMRVERNIDAIEKGDEIDLATDEISRELDARISMRQHRQIKEIEEALERLKHGEYGMCDECGEPIPEQRLRLFPAAKLCVRCQEEADLHEKLKDDHYIRSTTWRDDAADSSYAKTYED
jgi:DnaK suppressor protein